MQTYREFWPVYLAAHKDKRSRACHFIGSTLALFFLGVALVTHNGWFLAGAPLSGYGAAWIGHFGFEHNRPATFGHPVWSLASDYRMYGLWLTGGLAAERAKYGF
jgi:hypothetical protein